MQPRPVSAMVFGILNIGYGAFNLLSLFIMQALAGAKLGPHSPLQALSSDPGQMRLMWATGVISAVAGVFLVAAGAGLLLCKNWGRIGSLAWAVFDIIVVVVTLPLSWKAAQASAPQFGNGFAVVVTLFGVFFNLLYPAALLIFMTRPKLVAACKGQAGA